MARKIINIVWNTYWYLKVLELHNIINKRTFWKCKCNCWNIIIVTKWNLTCWNTQSCWCYANNNATTHNMSNTIFYNKYSQIKERCNNKNCKSFKNYWWRWIKCEWNNFEEFKNDMYDSYLKHCEEFWQKQTTIDRIDVNWNYCKKNCRWATKKEQCNNTNRNKYIEYNWETKTLMEWCNYLKLNYSKTLQRINTLWWSIEKSFEK